MTHDYNLGWILVNYAAAFICRVREGREYISIYDEFSKNHSRNTNLERDYPTSGENTFDSLSLSLSNRFLRLSLTCTLCTLMQST